MKSLFVTYFLLLLLLASTFFAHQFNLGGYGTLVSLLIAFCKVMLIAWIFMELKQSDALIKLTASAAIIWVFFFYFVSSLDFFYRATMKGSAWQ